jgi:transposase InsO family protein
VTAQGKYEIIHALVHREGNLLSIASLCRLAGVSRSGYYDWEHGAEARDEREAADRADFDKILAAYKYRGYAKGARGIYMRLLHTGTRMNLKKIRRLMRKYGLKCPYRGPNPYRQMAKALKTNSVFPNVVNREFTKNGPRRVLLTDITYLFYRGGVCYLSTILDAFTREVLAYELSTNLMVEFVLNTVAALVREHGCELDDTVIVHSDQGCHYTSRAFIQMLKDERFVQSMSRKGNCWDNAPQESFFGHMKDEIRGEIAGMTRFEEVRAKVDDWMDYYNNDRYQWELAKLSPREFYQYTLTGVYPITV